MRKTSSTKPSPAATNSLLVTVEETCGLMKLSRGTIFNLRRQGLLKSVQIGRSARITRESIDALIASAIAN